MQLKYINKNKGVITYIDERSKVLGNITSFINSAQPETTKKPPNCIFEGCDGNRVVVCAIKIIATREELSIDCDLN